MPKFSSFSALRRHVLAASLTFIVLQATALPAGVPLLNVSYDVTRELFKEINPVFIAE
jgi:sulfate transport system substrate-binding protein